MTDSRRKIVIKVRHLCNININIDISGNRDGNSSFAEPFKSSAAGTLACARACIRIYKIICMRGSNRVPALLVMYL